MRRSALIVAALFTAVLLGWNLPSATADDPAPMASVEPTNEPTTGPSIQPTTEPTSEPTPTPSPSATPTASPSPSPTPTTREVRLDNAELRWGMTKQANSESHQRGWWHFFGAGDGYLGAAGTKLSDSSQWKQKDGNVTIEKESGAAATWSGLSAASPSGHQFVFRGGDGEVDRTAKTLTVTWKGDVSVLWYAGDSRFQISDPVLTIADGKGRLTATVSGAGGSRDGDDISTAEPREVTLADLPAVTIPAADQPPGFEALKPAYDSVQVTSATHGSVTDSFPQSFISFQDELGTGPFWFGDSAAKRPLPITVSFDADDPVETPESTEGEAETSSDDISNDAPTAPNRSGRNPGLTRTPTMLAAPAATPLPAALDGLPETPLRLVSAVVSANRSVFWILGIVFFALAGTTVATALSLPRWLQSRKSGARIARRSS